MERWTTIMETKQQIWNHDRKFQNRKNPHQSERWWKTENWKFTERGKKAEMNLLMLLFVLIVIKGIHMVLF